MDILLQSFRNHQKVRGNPIRPLQTQLEHTVQRALTSKCTKRQCARVYKYEYKNTHTYIYIYIYIYTHTHEYTQPATIQLQPPPRNMPTCLACLYHRCLSAELHVHRRWPQPLNLLNLFSCTVCLTSHPVTALCT